MQTSENNLITIKNDRMSAAIDCHGSQLRSLKKDGEELLWQGDKAFWEDTSPVLFPICGGLRDDSYLLSGKRFQMQKHGFACAMDFKGKQISQCSAEFTLRSNELTRAQYPYEFVFKTVFTLEGTTLRTDYITENPNDGDMFYSVGAHEGFAVSEGIEACELIFNKTEKFDTCLLDGEILGRGKEKVLPDGKVLPLLEKYFEIDALIFEAVSSDCVTLFNRSSSRKITVNFGGFENLLIWAMPGGKFICIEPWSGFPDYSDTDGDFTKKNAIQKIPPHSIDTKTHTVTV